MPFMDLKQVSPPILILFPCHYTLSNMMRYFLLLTQYWTFLSFLFSHFLHFHFSLVLPLLVFVHLTYFPFQAYKLIYGVADIRDDELGFDFDERVNDDVSSQYDESNTWITAVIHKICSVNCSYMNCFTCRVYTPWL